ncbi:MAG: hypothetical protein IJ058_04215 [Lachnospiraceae bacterium]|nr:hypothetical protein [Lachnospiraceae bacterium]
MTGYNEYYMETDPLKRTSILKSIVNGADEGETDESITEKVGTNDTDEEITGSTGMAHESDREFISSMVRAHEARYAIDRDIKKGIFHIGRRERDAEGKMTGDREHFTDRFLGVCLEFTALYNDRLSISRSTKKRFTAATQILRCDMAVSGTETQKRALFLEYKNTALCYMETCKAPDYRSVMGLVSADETSRRNQLEEDIRIITTGIAELYDTQNKLELWKRAFEETITSLSKY